VMLLSLMMTASDVWTHLEDEAGRKQAVAWCKARGVKRVYLATRKWKDDRKTVYDVPEDVHHACLEAFGEAGIEVCGRVGPGNVGTRPSTGWKETPCLTDERALVEIREQFAFAGGRFNRIIIDNRLFYDCTCPTCDAARGDASWRAFHQQRLTEVMQSCVLDVVREVNPDAKIIFKFASWYEMIASRGYDIVQHTKMYPATCAGAETRDPTAVDKWGGRQPYGAFFGTAYLRHPAPEKCPGAWIDAFACDKETYVWQAWGSVLAGASEIVLFSYGHLIGERRGDDTAYPPINEAVDHLVALRPRMDELAEIVQKQPVCGIAGFRDPVGDPKGEPYVFDYLGMLGLPIVPVIAFPDDALAGAFAVSSAGSGDFKERLAGYIASGRPTLVTSRLLDEIGLQVEDAPNVTIMSTHDVRFTDRMARMPGDGVYDDPSLARADRWLEMDQAQLDALRRPFYEALQLNIDVPTGVGVFPLGGCCLVLCNYNAYPVQADVGSADLLWCAPDAESDSQAASGILPGASLSVWRMR